MLLLAMAVGVRGDYVPYLVKDLAPGDRIVDIEPSFHAKAVGEVVFFTALHGEPGLWRTDGTFAGTHRIYDGLLDHGGGYGALGAGNSKLFVGAVDTWDLEPETWLVASDGSSPGTSVVRRFPRFHTGVACGDDRLCVITQDGSIWTTDGTLNGTELMFGASDTARGFYARELGPAGERIFFNAYDEDHGRCITVDSIYQRLCGELWETNGTTEGTRLFKDLMPGIWPGGPYDFFVSSRGTLFFRALHPASTPETLFCVHWASDGTPEGTMALGEQRRFSCNSSKFVEAGEHVFFGGAFGELFASQGTPQTTRAIWPEQPDYADTPRSIHVAAGRFVFDTARGLFGWDGERPVALRMSSDIDVIDAIEATQQLYFVSEGDLWRSDGTPDGTRRLFPFFGNSLFAKTRTRLFTRSPDGVRVTDGTPAGTREIALQSRVARSSSVRDLISFGEKVYFRTETPAALYVSDGTAEGTIELMERRNGSSIFEHEGRLYFNDYTLWTTDGTREGTRLVRDWLGVDSIPHPPAFIGDAAIFAGGDPDVLMRRDPDGTLTELTTAKPGWMWDFRSIHGRVVFQAFDLEQQVTSLNVTDGTREGTHTIMSGSYEIAEIAPLGAGIMFGARTSSGAPLQLWRADLEAAGAEAVATVSTDSWDDLLPLVHLGDVGLFAVGDAGWMPQEGEPVWRTDGSAEGTYRLTEHVFHHAVMYDGRALLVRELPAPEYGWEVWESDGSIAGTRALRSGVGTLAGAPFELPEGDPALAYLTRTSVTRTLTIMNLRTFSTIDVNLGVIGFGGGVAAGDRLFLSACRGRSGCELWAVKLDPSAIPPAGVVRVDAIGTVATTTGIGAAFRIHLEPGGATDSRVIASTADGTLKAQTDYVAFSREIVFDDDHDVTIVVPLTGARTAGSVSLVLSSPSGAVIEKGMATALVNGRRRAASH